MEEKLRNKAFAALAVMILIFSIYSSYLALIVPKREHVMSTNIDFFDSMLDSWNYSELRGVFSQASFAQNYTVSGAPSDPDTWLIIEPKNNSYFAVHVVDYDGDIYLYVRGFMMVGAFGTIGSWTEMEADIQYELKIILSYIGHPELAENLLWDDNDFATWPMFHHVFAFFGFAALILLTVFMIIFRKGWLLANIRLIDRNVPLFFGVIALYFAFGFGLMCAWITFAGTGPNEMLICWALPAAQLIVGTYLIIAETKALAQ